MTATKIATTSTMPATTAAAATDAQRRRCNHGAGPQPVIEGTPAEVALNQEGGRENDSAVTIAAATTAAATTMARHRDRRPNGGYGQNGQRDDVAAREQAASAATEAPSAGTTAAVGEPVRRPSRPAVEAVAGGSCRPGRAQRGGRRERRCPSPAASAPPAHQCRSGRRRPAAMPPASRAGEVMRQPRADSGDAEPALSTSTTDRPTFRRCKRREKSPPFSFGLICRSPISMRLERNIGPCTHIWRELDPARMSGSVTAI